MPKFFFCLLLSFSVVANGQNKSTLSPQGVDSNLYVSHASQIVIALQRHQTPVNHLFKRAGWWNAANIMEAMIDYDKISGADLSKTCHQIFKANRHIMQGGFRNWAYDDSGWWAMAWIKAYDLYHKPRYLKTAAGIFEYMLHNGWDERCSGGMNWMRSHPYKNAITNELFILLAARLASHETDTTRKAYYLNWSIKGYNWLAQSGMLNTDHLYNDGLDINCKNNHGNTWTYNQGVILAAEKELYLLTGNDEYLRSAHKTALACMHKVADAESILTDKLGKDAGLDCPQFKGIFIRELAELNTLLKDPAIKRFILHNADIAWKQAQNEDHLFDFRWQGPYQSWTSVATGAALDLMNAAAREMQH
jgi:predicted alpha-1,6-mannanase (GH76 family)